MPLGSINATLDDSKYLGTEACSPSLHASPRSLPAACVRYAVSSIQYPVSSIQYPVSAILAAVMMAEEIKWRQPAVGTRRERKTQASARRSVSVRVARPHVSPWDPALRCGSMVTGGADGCNARSTQPPRHSGTEAEIAALATLCFVSSPNHDNHGDTARCSGCRL
ncbi:hypothetical protein K431DRAFT_296699 [Polychaeton citri CBS 116435]|uniref:Uncharacterized protein n=1 Tax=Polychaeton citri CBS 116435 TaxID=1314669 RepID=A0A9P4Q3A4_9PEZI|nr:hypothetical protein K431DRAFT_296699 [Polychaeton citri CBS 116435]